MAASIKDDNYFTVHGWMITRLHLSGTELIVYAIIHGITQDGESGFFGTQDYLASWTGCSKRTVIRALQSLIDAGHLIARPFRYKDSPRVEYRVNRAELDGLHVVDHSDKMSPCPDHSDKMSQTTVTICHHHSDNLSPNNKYNNKDKYNYVPNAQPGALLTAPSAEARTEAGHPQKQVSGGEAGTPPTLPPFRDEEASEATKAEASKTKPKTDYARYMAAYNASCGGTLPTVRSCGIARKRLLDKLDRTLSDIGMTPEQYFRQVADSDFLMGRKAGARDARYRDWLPTFDWLIGSEDSGLGAKSVVDRIIDGAYGNGGTRHQLAGSARTTDYSTLMD